jgi:diguanylate cyclase (GGDEF)-like protein
VLSEVAGLLHRTVRAYDILLRWRGAELLIVLPGVGVEEAQLVAARIRYEVGMYISSGVGSLTVSSAVATMDDYDFNEMLWRAERELDQAKRSGGDLTDPDTSVRDPRKRGPDDRDSAATVNEP